jgi:Ca-activated chloride channel homolog
MKAFFFPMAVAMCCAAVYAQQAVAPAAQKPAEIADDSPTRIILDVTRVNMLFTVTDKKGRFVTDLAKDDFQVFENKNLQTIAEFTAETDLPCAWAS